MGSGGHVRLLGSAAESGQSTRAHQGTAGLLARNQGVARRASMYGAGAQRLIGRAALLPVNAFPHVRHADASLSVGSTGRQPREGSLCNGHGRPA